ncbi:TRAP transporter small permease subunit [Geomicrobium sediminis]|uniref:TRAP-type C4-dicarboxylate transport system permease small subunit n=1 Tax=Geomicrobium sediminis TaxID=1347788 RepID=A0ABS2PAH2_9BACL|nr:TRAP transporter small permease [Geomicrobium sediminis]MBM7632394.1 TRAP-type C4-dicarboxylate transport system permease small subunit [Geomicrobium sediminis]
MRFVALIRMINNSMLWVVGSIAFIMALLLFTDVILRYFFNSPSVWNYDLTAWFTGLTAFLAGGYCLLHREHVRVDIFYEKFSERKRSVIDLFTALFIFLISGVFIVYGGAYVIHLIELGAVASTGLNISLWIKWIMVPIGGLLLLLQAIVDLINDIHTIVKGHKLWEVEG